MSETLKMIVRELPRSMGELNHQLLYDDLKQALKEVEVLEQQLATARREADSSAEDAFRRGWEQWKAEAAELVEQRRFAFDPWASIADAIAAMEYKKEMK